MDLNKSQEYFNPEEHVDNKIHIIGCGALGSTLAELLTRLGIQEIDLWDFDTVASHNIANQMFKHKQIGEQKVIATKENLLEINPGIKVKTHEKGWSEDILSGFVFLALDSIELRKKICEINIYNPNIVALFDTRMGLESGQHHAVEWTNTKQKENLIKGMDFTDEEAKEITPVSACGFELSVAPTIRYLCAVTISNFMNYCKTGEITNLYITNSFQGITVTQKY